MSSKKAVLKQADAVMLVPLGLIDESPTNTRKTFNPEKLNELAASLREHGLQQPVTVRPMGTRYELVFGHRRFRAAALADLKTLPARVRELEDAEVRELQLVENNQREDVDPLEEADGYRELMEKHGYQVEDLAAKTGKSKAFVLGRLSLCNLCPAGRKAYAAGRLALYGALAVSRIPDEGLQLEATKELTRFADPLGPRQVRELIEQRFMLALKTAPFSIADAELVPGVGSCNACPKRTGNQPELFSDASRNDLCTDSGCFNAKKEAGWTQKLEAALAKGQEVLEDETCAKLYPYAGGQLGYGSEYVDLADRCGLDPKMRTWGAVLGTTKPPIYLARDRSGRAHQLVRLEDAKALLKQSPVAAARAVARAAEASGESHKAREKRERKAQELRRRTVARGMEAIVSAVASKPLGEEVWRYIAEGFLRGSWSDVVRDVAKRRGLVGKGEHPSEVLGKAITSMGASELAALTVECLAWRFAASPHGGGYGEAFTGACEVFGLDIQALEREAAAEEKQKPLKQAKTDATLEGGDEDLGVQDEAGVMA